MPRRYPRLRKKMCCKEPSSDNGLFLPIPTTTPTTITITTPTTITTPIAKATTNMKKKVEKAVNPNPFIRFHPRTQLFHPVGTSMYVVKDRAFLLGLDVRGTLPQIVQRMQRHIGLGHGRHVRFDVHVSYLPTLRKLLDAYAHRIMMPIEVDACLAMLKANTQEHIEPEPTVYYKHLFRRLNNVTGSVIKTSIKAVNASVVFQLVKQDTRDTRELKGCLLQYATDKDTIFPRDNLRPQMEALYHAHIAESSTATLFWRAFLFARETEGDLAFTRVLQLHDAEEAKLFSSSWSVFLALFLPCTPTLTPAKLDACAPILLAEQPIPNLLIALAPLPSPLHRTIPNSANGFHYLRLVRRNNPWPNGTQHPIHVWRNGFNAFMVNWQQRIGNMAQFRDTVLIPMLRTLGTPYNGKRKRTLFYITAVRHAEEARIRYVEKRWKGGLVDPPHRYLQRHKRYKRKRPASTQGMIAPSPLVGQRQPLLRGDQVASRSRAKRPKYNFFETTDRSTYFDPNPSVSQCPNPSTTLHPAWEQCAHAAFKAWVAQWQPKHQPCTLFHLIRAFESHWATAKKGLSTKLTKDEYDNLRRHLRGEPPFLELKTLFLVWLEQLGKRMTAKKKKDKDIQTNTLSKYDALHIRIT